MFGPTRRSASERERLSTWAKIVLLLPACAVLLFGLRAAGFSTTGSVASGHSSFYRGIVTVCIANIQDPSSQWLVHSLPAWQSCAGDSVSVSYTKQLTWQYHGLFSLQPTTQSIYRNTLDYIGAPQGRALYSDAQRIVDAFEREFGVAWRSLQHQGLQAAVLSEVELAISDQMMSFIPADLRSSSVSTGSLAGGGAMLLRTQQPLDRWKILPQFFSGTIPLWIFLSLGLIAFSSVSRERKARRWVAMKCPRCGYERQRNRDECPECGLVYERPSYVLWDPTEEGADAGERRKDA